MIERDRKILTMLEKFRVLSRDQIGKIACTGMSDPSATATRICKRLARDGFVNIITQHRDKQYLYMPNPTLIPKNSTRIPHFLTIADVFIQEDQPETFVVEPIIGNHYRPDVYAIIEEPIVIEVQRTLIPNKKMQEKVNEFQKSFYRGEHNARTLWIQGTGSYHLKADSKFVIIQGTRLNSSLTLTS